MRVLAAILLVAAIYTRSGYARPRPADVPQQAVWVGGADGGVWIHCDRIVYSPDRYRCAIYFDSTGERWDRGDYLLRRATWNSERRRTEYSRPTAFPRTLRFSAFDGTRILLQDSLVLVPERPRQRRPKT